MRQTANKKPASHAGEADPDQKYRHQHREDYQTLKGDATGPVERIRIGKAIIKERARPVGPKNLGLMRQREIERLITSRHGGIVPDPQDIEDRDTALVYARAVAFSMTGQPIAAWAQRWAPWMRSDEIDAIEWEAQHRNRKLRADTAARFLGVRYAERIALNLRTIGSCDLSRTKRNELARQSKQRRDRERQDRLSREAGRKKRNPDEPKPWEIAGVSRRTWYRKKAWHSILANKSPNRTSENSVPTAESLSSEKRKEESFSMPQSQPQVERSPYLGAASDVEKSVPRPQALVAEGSVPLGTKAAEARTRETGLPTSSAKAPFIPGIVIRRTA